MIIKLQKKLTIIFIISIMLLFTGTFCVIIKKDIANSRETAREYFRSSSDCILFNLETENIESTPFSFYEQAEHIAFYLEDNNNHVIYQTDASYFADLTDVIHVLKAEFKKELSESLIDTRISSSGVLPYSFQDSLYMGIRCKILESDATRYTLYIVKQDTSFSDFIQNNAGMYLFIWVSMLIFTIFISHILMKKTAKPTEQAIQSQKNFIASASHELKSPLAVIMANTEIAASDPELNAQLSQHMAAIDSEVVRMSDLVQNLLLLSSIDASTWELNKETLDIYTSVLTIYEKFEPLCKKNNITLELDLVDDVFPKFTADAARFEQILGIFLDNAIYYGNPDTTIKLSVRSESKWIIFTVQDHGIGIKDSVKPFIYDRFYQADPSRTNKQHYGLGLSIAKELVLMHKGKIELHDTPGGGCTFHIFFPIK